MILCIVWPAGLYGNVVEHSDFQMTLRPPEESTHDVEKSLDALLKVLLRPPLHSTSSLYPQCMRQVEESKETAAEDEAAAAKQRMLNIESLKIR